ncbi:MAG: mRNA cap guanine-N7 methyltransferase [Ramalina farinacea]|uniref:mRNA cap guanine-N(7) methyltransferase n=1 Tax=Ramalina farinacea TaxID=258253 RepID=A0AA43TX06_9LECA|nr:mRNA cap guanine-N7 methyltransferase [Ramalina farinacea]
MSANPQKRPLEEDESSQSSHPNKRARENKDPLKGLHASKRPREDGAPTRPFKPPNRRPVSDASHPPDPSRSNASKPPNDDHEASKSSQTIETRPLQYITNSSEPPRPRKRPGAASRIPRSEAEAVQQRQRQRETAASAVLSQNRGNEEVVRQHYNAVPQRGREWRKTDSRIKGLRSFNNWIKSTLIHKFSPNEEGKEDQPLNVLDIGCGKGGDLGKWAQAPQAVGYYVGIDPAEVSIEQAKERYMQMRPGGGGRGGRGGGGGGGRNKRIFEAAFLVDDAFANSLGDLQIIREIGFGPGSRWGPSGGFDVVSMMFCMHYAYETEAKAKGMLANVASSLRKGGRFLGVIPNSDVIKIGVVDFHKKLQGSKASASAGEKSQEQPLANGHKPPESASNPGETQESVPLTEWGNSIYHIRFPSATPPEGIFRPPYGWKYSYFMEEAVEEVPEYLVPWEAFRAIAEDYNLELQYRKPFAEIWEEEGNSPVFGPLSERMGVRGRDGGELLVSSEEMEAASEC